MARVDIDINHTAILRLAVQTSGDLAEKGAESVAARARRFAPKRTGALAASIRPVLRLKGPTTIYEIGSDLHYAGYQEFGTGPIVPKKKNGVLAFVPKGGSQVVFARRTKGVPAVHYMQRAAARISIQDFK